MKGSGRWKGLTAVALGAAAVGAVAVTATAKVRIKQPLIATVHAPGASGQAKLVLKTGASGKFTVKARRLPGGQTFDVVVNRIKVGTLTTGPGGNGVAKFSTAPKGHATVLGFDPQGEPVEVRDDQGDDVLEGGMPDDNPDSAVGCCLPSHGGDGETECEDLTAAACTAAGGTVTAAMHCLPDPCGGTPPPPAIVCCLANSAAGAIVDDDPEVECEDTSAADCAAHGGSVVQATSCDPNPCQPVPPPQLVICCVPEAGDGEAECEHVTPDHCTAAGGTVSSAVSCDANPCGGSGGGEGGTGGGDD